MSVRLIALVLPLGLDTLGVALALGMVGFPPQRRLRLSLLFAGFEAAMPLIGIALGAPLGHAIGGVADYFAAALIVALGIYMLIEHGEDDEHERDRLLSMTQRGFLGGLALGISISLDELAIGFSAGLLRLPTLIMVIAIAMQAFVVTQVGVRLGSRVGTAAREGAEKLAGVALVALGVVLLVERLTA
ncbi:MAG: manganese efflux pump MntP [Solirubrobacteraceae bacterium]